MWVEKTPTGKYKVCDRYVDTITGKSRKVSVTIDKNTKAAIKAAQKILYDKMQAVPDPADYTLRQLADAYLADKARTLRASSVATYRSGVKTLLDILPGNIKVSRLTAGYVNSRLKTDDDPAAVNGHIGMFKKLIAWGYDNDFVQTKEWLDKIKPLKDNRKARIEDKYLEPGEITALIEAMANQRYQLFTRLLLLTGMRIGEAIALDMSDIGPEYIHIHRTYQNNIHKIGDAPKTADSERDIYIQPELAALIGEIKTWRLIRQVETGCRTNLVFFGRTGNYMAYVLYHGYLVEVSQAILGRSVSPHALRHTHVSILAAQGVPFDVIARRLGHHDDAITREVYFHVTDELREKDNAVVAKVKFAP